MKNSIILSIATISFLFVSSCNKEDLVISNPTIPAFLQTIVNAHACLDSDINGTLIIQSYKTIHTQTIETANISGHFNGSQGREDKGDLNIGSNITITPDNTNNYTSTDNLSFLYGTSTSIELKDDQNSYFNSNFTLPKMVKFTYPTPTDDFIIDNQSKTISWEADANNTAGVAIIINYSPTLPGNETFKSQGYDKTIINTNLKSDDGSYQLSNVDFNGIPDGSFITVRIARVGCDTVIDSETGGKYFLYGYTIVDALGTYMGGIQ
jgi:hypothetical protein